jgi:hypothetical protein
MGRASKLAKSNSSKSLWMELLPWHFSKRDQGLLPVPVCSTVFFTAVLSKFQVLTEDLWSTLNWYLHRVKDMDPVLVFYMQISSFPSTICWRGYLFSIVCFGHVCQKIRWLQLCGFVWVFCSIGLYVCCLCQYYAVFTSIEINLIFVPASVYMLHYIHWFASVESFLHPWNETDFIMVYDLFDMFLSLAFQYFTGKFFTCVH